MRNQFQFRAGSPPAMLAGREGRAPRPEITWQNEQAALPRTRASPARSFNPNNVYSTQKHGYTRTYNRYSHLSLPKIKDKSAHRAAAELQYDVLICKI